MFTELDEYIVSRVTFPLTNTLMNRRGVFSNYRQLAASQYYPEEQLKAIQLKRLQRTILYASRWVPYYRQLFKKIGLQPGDIRQLDDIKGIPPLSRQDLQDNVNELVDERISSSIPVANASRRGPGVPDSLAYFKKHKLIKNTSSGSTGAPTIFYEDGSITALNWSFETRFKTWFGVPPGAREARMNRMSTDFLPGNRQLIMRQKLWNQLVLPGSNLSEKDYLYCLQHIKAYQPKVIWGFTAALTGLAEYIRSTGDDVSGYRPKLLIGWAAPVYEHEERLLKEVFACDVTNIYGAREVGHIAAHCPHKNFHVNQEYLYIEQDETTYSDREEGELLVTTFVDTPMPFIRYRMGDIGAIAPSKCECGLKLQVLSNFLGRTGEIFITKDGHMIPPNFWCRTFMAYDMSESVKRFQVIYKKNDHIQIKIVKNSNYTQDKENYLRKFLETNYAGDMKIDLDYVEEIKPQLSGKYQMVVNETQ